MAITTAPKKPLLLPIPERCPCGERASWQRRYIVAGVSGTAEVSTVWAGCPSPSHRGSAVGQPVSRAVYEAALRSAWTVR
jgi:hypothetical protein